MSLAHLVTFLRIFLIPFFPLIYLWGSYYSIPVNVVPFILFVLLVICQVSDVLDGLFARIRNQVTDLGKVLDPMADSALSLSIFLCFTKPPVSIPIMLVLVFLYREFVISTLRILCALKGFALGARKSGKIKTILQAAVFFLILILMALKNFGMVSPPLFEKISLYSVSFVAFYTVFSAVDYIWANRRYIKMSLISKGTNS